MNDALMEDEAEMSLEEIARTYGRAGELALRLGSPNLDDALEEVEWTCEEVREGKLSAQAASEKLFGDGSAADAILEIVDA